ncbi:MAG: hypothetical protein H6923_09305 [Alphaproteobacteria bacterium]|nr:hypothetical protein [Alphaproteobacteria bacterium]
MITKLATGLAATALLATAVAQEPIPQASVDQLRTSCVASCTPMRPSGECQTLCTCAAEKVRTHWSAEDLRNAESRQQAGTADNEHFKRVVAQCMRENDL